MQSTPFGTGVEQFKVRRTSLWSLDPWLTFAALGLITFSVYVLAGATASDVPGSPLYFVVRQLIYGIIGVGLMLVFARIDFARFKEFKYGIYGLLIASILLVFAIGGATRGSRRWIEFPFFNFQPSELGKVLLIIALSAMVLDRVRRIDEPKTTLRIMALGVIPALLVLMQPDLGTGLVYIVITLTLLYIAGTKWTHFAAIGGVATVLILLALVVLPKAGISVLQEYQAQRLTAFLHPSAERDKASYQQNQALIALGSGRQAGRGFEHATQTRLDFLPEHHTDFIFSVVGESLGFSGAAVILALYALLIWRGLRILTLTRDQYGALVSGGVVAMLMFQVFVNVGMNTGIMPITGITLPLMSHGGSSVLVTFIALGLLQSVYMHEHRAVRNTAPERKSSGALAVRSL